MKLNRFSCAVALALTLPLAGVMAQSTPAAPAKAHAKAAAKPAAKAPAAHAAAVQAAPSAALPEQIDASERVYYGVYDCEFNQKIDVVASTKYPAYVDLKYGKSDYLMKPVLSPTGAIRLEDTRGQTLMVQIANKSMLLNVVSGQRLVDACISPKQRELIEAAAKAKAAS